MDTTRAAAAPHHGPSKLATMSAPAFPSRMETSVSGIGILNRFTSIPQSPTTVTTASLLRVARVAPLRTASVNFSEITVYAKCLQSITARSLPVRRAGLLGNVRIVHVIRNPPVDDDPKTE